MSDEQTGQGLAQIPTRVQVLPPSGPEILRQAEMARKAEEGVARDLMSLPRKQSETLGKLALALSRAQLTMLNAERDSTNPHFKSRFASLASVRAACGYALSEQEIAYFQPVKTYGRFAFVTTLFVHSSGEFIEETLVLVAADDKPQTLGSAITYGRRYGLAAMAGIAPADDDGEEASKHGPPGVRHDRANTPLQRATGSGVSDELVEGAEASRTGSPVAPGHLPSGTPAGSPASAVGTAPSASRQAPRPLARPVGTGTPPPPGKPPARAPGASEAPLKMGSPTAEKTS